MKKMTENQIVSILKEAEAGIPVKELYSANGWISPQQYEQQYYQNNKIIEVSTV